MSPDIAKIAEAISRPGIDPRKHVELGVVVASSVSADGAIYDVVTADGSHETVALSPVYGGPGYGLYAPVELDDTVLIAVPYGAPNAGGRIVGRLWDPGAAPPQDAIDNQDDLVIVVKPGRKIRIVVSGGGDAVIEARDGGHVLLGGEDASDAVQIRADGTTFLNALTAAIGTSPTTGVQALTALRTQLQNVGWPVGADRVRAK